MMRWTMWILLGVAGVGILLYAGDWMVLRVRLGRGTGFGTVTVSRFMVTPLKSGKAEYDFLDQTPESCTHSMFPQILIPPSGAAQESGEPCWWMEQHTTVNVLN